MRLILLTIALLSILSANSNKEKSEQIQKRFDKYDTNSDNKISFQEYIKYSQKQMIKQDLERVKKDIKACDKNGDGLVSVDEAADDNKTSHLGFMGAKKCSIPKKIVKMVDSNGDNMASKEEFISLFNPTYKLAQKFKKYVEKKNSKRRKSIERKMFNQCDKDKDTLLTLREATSRVCRMDSDTFYELDTNKDDMLSFEERQNTKHLRDKMQKNQLKSKEFAESKDEKRLMLALYMCDSNSDRFLSKDEAFDQDCAVDENIFKLFDTNKDGYIGGRETSNIYQYRFFKKFDTNKDGYINKEEFAKTPLAKKVDRQMY